MTHPSDETTRSLVDDDHEIQGGSEAQLRQAHRLESLGMLAGGVAHDFNNLLAVITSFGTFVAEEIEAARKIGCDHLDRAAQDIDRVLRASRRGVSLTQQLLTFGHRQVVHAEVLDVNTLITRFSQLLQRTLGEHIIIALELTDEPCMIMADPDQLERALLNLSLNARDAMSAGGTLRIETANVVVDANSARAQSGATEGPAVRIRVSDNGGGIPPAVLDQIFEPFFTTKGQGGGGSGLGLACVYGIVTQGGGIIQVNSRPGVGTAFTMLFPATSEASPAAFVSAPYERSPKGEIVLVVEDDEGLREITERIYLRNGYQVLTAANGTEAVDIARNCSGDIHLLLTDVVMPGMLGKEVAEKIRAILPHVHVLYMSGYAQPVLANQGRLEPGTVLLAKPFTEAELIKKSGQVLNGGFAGFRTSDPAVTS
ncbi:MAG: ATP-binding protein [Actinophytocola sp.]|uniref:ATP-binding protein n=1 Tax=Actinophytocola sp. TaxID=1872138 RepID=UPI003C78BAC9